MDTFLSSALIEFHDFSEAPRKAYYAFIYARATPIHTLLFVLMTVAPIEVISLPKLEFCGAVLLAKIC